MLLNYLVYEVEIDLLSVTSTIGGTQICQSPKLEPPRYKVTASDKNTGHGPQNPNAV